MAIRPRLIAWAEPRHEPMIRSLIADNACELIGVCSARAGDAATLARALGAEPLADLRQAILSPDTEAVWLASPASLDAALCSAIREHGLLVLTSEPMPDVLAKQTGDAHEADVATFVPAFVDGEGFAAALDAMEQFGPCQAVNLVFTAIPMHGSLFARLFDAMLTARKLIGAAELVDAAMTVPRSSVPDKLASLSGAMTLHLRFENQRSANVLVTNTGPIWHREALLFGTDGRCLRVTEETANWLEDEEPPSPLPSSVDPGALIAERLMRLMQLPDEPRSHGDGAQLLAMCEAARLSAKVGVSEAPGTISHMMSRP